MSKPNPYFRVRPDRSINIFGEINDDLVSKVAPEILRLRHESDEPISLLINSPGGSSRNAEMINGLLRTPDPDGKRLRIVAVALGDAASAAADLLVQSDYAIAYPTARLHFHGTRLESVSDITVEASYSIGSFLGQQNSVVAMRSANASIGRAVLRYVYAKPRFAEMRKQDNLLTTDVECFARHILENTNSRNTFRVVERAVEKWKKLNELLAYVDRKMAALSEEQEIPNSQFFQFILDYAKERDADTFDRFSDATKAQIFTDHDIIGDYLTGEHRKPLLAIIRRFGIYFLNDQDSQTYMLDDAKSQEERDAWLMPRVSPELNSLWYFVVSLWRNLQEDENPLSPEDAYWLGVIDEVQGSMLPCTRLAVERISEQTGDQKSQQVDPEPGHEQSEVGPG